MKKFASYLGVEKFPKKKSFSNIAPIFEKIQQKGYDIYIKDNYVGIWRNFSRGYREAYFSIDQKPIDAAYSCCLKFIEYELRKQ